MNSHGWFCEKKLAMAFDLAVLGRICRFKDVRVTEGTGDASANGFGDRNGFGEREREASSAGWSSVAAGEEKLKSFSTSAR